MSDYVHCYSDYVQHILNTSPSKKVFTFSKAPRFPEPKQEESPEDSDLCPRYHRYRDHSTSEEKRRVGRVKRERMENQSPKRMGRFGRDYELKEQVEQILREISRKREQKSKDRSPLRQKSNNRLRINTDYSPFENKIKEKRRKSPSPEGPRLTQTARPAKRTPTHKLPTSQTPTNARSITGYYPVGVETSPDGKYISSKIRNVTGPKFVQSPNGRYPTPAPQQDSVPGPGYYQRFSEFGSKERQF